MTKKAPLLRARGLGRHYRRVAALSGVDLDLHAGEAVALLGPNGAGKTTLLSILAGVGRRDSGTLTWSAGTTRRVGWVPQRPAVYPRLRTRENLELFSALEGAPDPAARARDLMARAGLEPYAERQAAALSTGTLQRLNLAITLAGEPAVLLLDEPTATLSPDQRRRLWQWLDELRAPATSAVLFSTQSMDEARRHSDRMLVLVDGSTAFQGTPAEMIARYGRAEEGEGDDPDRAFMRLLAEATEEGAP